jgi:hypothetical protein
VLRKVVRRREKLPIVEIDGKVYKKMSIEKASEIVFSKLPKKVK